LVDFKDKKLWGLALAVLVVVGLAVVYFTGIFEIPIVSSTKPAQLLVIGMPSLETRAVLDNSKDIVQYRVIEDPGALKANPQEKLAQYSIVMLDQSNSQQKTLPSTLGEALNKYVKKGGKLIVVKNSGIYNSEAPELVGWTANLGSGLMPVACIMTPENQPSCNTPINVTAELERADFKSPIMRGIERVPATPDQPYLYLEVFPVSMKGHEIATVKDVQSTKYYAGIVENSFLLGKVLYFNYNPGYTPGIFRNALEYLK